MSPPLRSVWLWVLLLQASSLLAGPPRLRVEGRWLRDPQDRVVMLRGVNYSHRAKHRPYLGWQRTEHFDRIAEWGFNCVRLLVIWDALEPTPGSYDLEYLDALEEQIRWAADRGLYVLLDMHQDIFSPAFGGDGMPAWSAVDDVVEPNWLWRPWFWTYLTPEVMLSFRRFWRSDALQSSFANAWKQLARRARGHPNVVGYDLLNEPFPGFVNPAIFETRHLRRFQDRVAAEIRAEHPEAVVFVEPSAVTANNGIPSRLPMPAGPAVYAPHFYDPLIMLERPYTSRRRWFASSGFRVMSRHAARRGVPLFLGEFGAHRSLPGAREAMRDQTELMDQHLVAGWCYWNYNPYGTALIDQVEPLESDPMSLEVDGVEHPAADVLVRAYPRAVAGEPLQLSFDPDRHELDLSWRPGKNGGDTVIYLPQRHYPNGFELAAPATTRWNPASRELVVTAPPGDGARPLRVVVATPGGAAPSPSPGTRRYR